MKTVGIIAEYNPFHRGHAYQLNKARELTGADYVVVVMSGCFVQRGFPALADKYVRAEMALRGGADLVLELPVPYAAGSAEAFAQGAVSLLDSLGCVDALCFGSECGDLAALLSYARLFEEEPEGFCGLLQENLKSGLSFPAARSRAAEEYLNYTERILPCSPADADCRSASDLLQSPNNILGIEYCRALMRRHSRIVPVTVSRRASGYHDPSMDLELASASAIRGAILREGLSDAVRGQLPPSSYELLSRAFEKAGPVDADDISSMLLYRLLSLSVQELAAFQDITADLAARIENHKYSFTSFLSFADLLKTRQNTHTRITRALCHILLCLTKDELDTLKGMGYPAYPRVLGFRRASSPLLAQIKEKGTSPLLVKTADASDLLTPVQLALFEKDVYAAHVYEAVKTARFGVSIKHEYTRSPVIL